MWFVKMDNDLKCDKCFQDHSYSANFYQETDQIRLDRGCEKMRIQVQNDIKIQVLNDLLNIMQWQPPVLWYNFKKSSTTSEKGN